MNNNTTDQPVTTAHDEISAALEAHPSIHGMVADMRQLFDLTPAPARRGAFLLLVASLVAHLSDDPKRAVSELNAHALDALQRQCYTSHTKSLGVDCGSDSSAADRSSPLESRRLWSLRDMIELDLKLFLDAQDSLAQFVHLLANDARFKVEVNAQLREHYNGLLEPLMRELRKHGLYMCAVAGDRVQETLRTTANSRSILHAIQDLRTRLLDQASLTWCLSLSNQERELYESTTPPFGLQVEAAFPSATEDIYESGKCLALQRGTACVMHLMRVVEAGLAALAGKLDVPKQNDWGAYLRKIEGELRVRIQAGRVRTTEEQFYAEAAVTIDHMRRAWRNPTMHVDRSYSIERASEIRDSVKSFMVHLSMEVSE